MKNFFIIPLHVCLISLLKGYFCYKTIISQDVLSEAQVNIFFISQKNYIPFSGYLKNPKLLAYIDFIYTTTMQLCQLNQSNLLLTFLYVHKLKFISHNLHPPSSSHGQLHELHEHIFECHTRLFVEPAICQFQKQPFANVFQNRCS